MKYLIDTHVLIWFSEDDQRLPTRIKTILEDNDSEIFVSHATIWEMAIKISLGKLKILNSLDDWEQVLAKNSIALIPNSFKHYQILLSLPLHHQDPFDRLIIAQAISEDFTLISHDPKFSDYPVKLETF
jgi:PIN domain nuclease of toxin-antitoxin system